MNKRFELNLSPVSVILFASGAVILSLSIANLVQLGILGMLGIGLGGGLMFQVLK